MREFLGKACNSATDITSGFGLAGPFRRFERRGILKAREINKAIYKNWRKSQVVLHAMCNMKREQSVHL